MNYNCNAVIIDKHLGGYPASAVNSNCAVWRTGQKVMFTEFSDLLVHEKPHISPYVVTRKNLIRFYRALGVSHVMRSINVRYLLTYLLTYLLRQRLAYELIIHALVLLWDV